MLRIYLIGIAILIVAIIANAIVKVDLKSWYGFIEFVTAIGTSAFEKLSFLDYVWLFIGYPLVLGFGYWVGNEFSKLIS